MKALIRNIGETVRESDGIAGIDWTTGAPLTNPSWAGGPYALAQDAPLDAIPSDFDITEVEETVAEATEDQPAETIVRRQAVLNTDRYNARIASEGGEPAQEPAGDTETPSEDAEPAPEVIEAQEAPSEEPADDGDETVTINGVTYTKAQLRAIMGEE